MVNRKNQLAQNIPAKSTLNDIDREPTTAELAEKVTPWEQEDNYIEPTQKNQPRMRIGERKVYCEHFSGLLEACTTFDPNTGEEIEQPPRYELKITDTERPEDYLILTLDATDLDGLKKWKQRVNRRYNGECYREFNKDVSRDAAAPVQHFKVGAFARYMRSHPLTIRYGLKQWTDRNTNEYHECYGLFWYDPDKDAMQNRWKW